ncbi:hypothetical protein LSUE1_G006251 [Lachnellula suecica]|uniref:Uncharacterized protein n=1 Tax=Lachnellula suecica TaxID=602035 RepID=A0A8T9C7X4_9HELO|nr:hypothetical protein LSUE1_G006251 [Lachnellula suecica]
MSSDQERNLRRLAKRYRISFKTPLASEQWPAVHKNHFERVQKIGSQRFDSYCANIDIRSIDEPWKERTKFRAEWLAKRASKLVTQQRNEAG